MKKYSAAIFFFNTIFLLYGFVQDNSYFKIEKRDVEFRVPKGFPKPVYNLKENKITPAGFILGRKLFYDPILSKDYFTSCATCHQRFAAFAHVDHPLSHGILGKIGKRNVPALQNLAWKDAFMADGGINHLDLQPIAPITSPVEMDESLENAITKLQKDTIYPAMFSNAFGDTSITTERMLKAISQFLLLMVSDNSRYDKYARGEEKFTDQEKHGLELFRSKCENCHKEPLFTDNSYRNIGLPPDTSLKDAGRAAISGMETDNNKFKVPTLRNVEVTYPYGHDGRFRKLKDIVRHYSNPEEFSPNADSSLYKIGSLTEFDQKDIIAFLLTLTDKEFLYDRRFADPNFK